MTRFEYYSAAAAECAKLNKYAAFFFMERKVEEMVDDFGISWTEAYEYFNDLVAKA